MKYWEMDIFEQMDAIVDDFFTSLDNVIIYEEPEEEEEEPEEEEDKNWYSQYTEKEMIEAEIYDDERGAWEKWE